MEEMGKDIGFTSSDKVHLVGYKPVMTEGNEKLIHHLTLYICEGDVSVEGGASFEDNEGGFSGMDGSDLEHQKVLPACTSMPPGKRCIVCTIHLFFTILTRDKMC